MMKMWCEMLFDMYKTWQKTMPDLYLFLLIHFFILPITFKLACCPYAFPYDKINWSLSSSSSSEVTRSRVWLSSFLILVGLQMGVEAGPGPNYICAMWAGKCGCSGGGFGLGLLGGCSVLSESALVFWSMAEVIIQCSALTDTGSLGRPVFCHVFPSFKVYVALFYICLNVVLMPLLLASWACFPSTSWE